MAFTEQARNDLQKKTAHAEEQEREDVSKARAQWREKQPKLDLKNLVFIDENGITTKMARLRGRSPKGKPLVAAVPMDIGKPTHLSQDCVMMTLLHHGSLMAH